MTFDEAINTEATALFEAKSDLEIYDGERWQWLANQPLREQIFSDKRNSSALASPAGLRLNNGMSVRFLIR